MSSEIPIIFVLGAPGSGKTTLCTRLTENFQVQHISVGNLLRRIKDDPDHPDSEALAIALPKQELIPSSILFPILKTEVERVTKRELESKVILVDGFPRCLDQQKEFEEKYGLPKLVLLFNCAEEKAKERYLKRKLEGREADNEDTFDQRYKEYERLNKDIANGYWERGLLLEVDTGGKRDETWKKLCDLLLSDVKWNKVIFS